MKKIIGKVNVTNELKNWWESDLTDIFLEPDKITIISAVEYNGGLYLIYMFEVDSEPEFEVSDTTMLPKKQNLH